MPKPSLNAASQACVLVLALGVVACQNHGTQANLSLAPEVSSPASQGRLELRLNGLPYALQGLADLASLRVRLRRADQPLAERTVDATALQAGQGRVTFEGLAPGPLQVQAEALDAQGQTIGYAQSEASVAAGETARVALRLAVGAPSTTSALGLDLTVEEGEASAGARPMRLVAAAPLPWNESHYGCMVHPDDGGVWVGGANHLDHPTSPHRLIRFSPDLGASTSHPIAQAPRSLAPQPDGALLVVDDAGALRRFTPSTGQTEDLANTTSPNPPMRCEDTLVGSSPQGHWWRWTGHNNRLDGPLLPNNASALPGYWSTEGGAYALSPNLYVPAIGASFIALTHQLIPDGVPGQWLFVAPNRALRFDLRGNAKLLLTAPAPAPAGVGGNTTTPVPLHLHHTLETHLNEGKNLAVGIDAMVPDGRGGHWVVLTATAPPYTTIFRRSPQGSLVRVWGPFLSAQESQMVRQRVRPTLPHPHFNHLAELYEHYHQLTTDPQQGGGDYLGGTGSGVAYFLNQAASHQGRLYLQAGATLYCFQEDG